ncbi:MAG: acetamidase/formamidase family protein [Thermoplasmata archaeon]
MINIDGTKIENLHFKWSSNNKPIAYVSAEEEILVKVPDASTMQITEQFKTEDLKNLDQSKLDGAVGPIYINEAKKGDLLEIELLDIKVGSWGWSAILPDFGLLKNRFNEALIIWNIKDNIATTGPLLKNVKVPVSPFLGVIGTAPESGAFDMIPPQHFGGNMDNKLLGKHAKLYLPVLVNGALLSISDPHASQGDGEVCGTAIETTATAKIKTRILKRKNLKYPYAIINIEQKKEELLVTMGIAADLYKAAQYAVEDMISMLEKYGFSAEEAYILSSVAGNLRISEIVDEPHFVVSLTMPKKLVEV